MESPSLEEENVIKDVIKYIERIHRIHRMNKIEGETNGDALKAIRNLFRLEK